MRCLEIALAIVSACVGAGFATGREIVSFFARYGAAGMAGCALAAALLGALCAGTMRAARRLSAAELGALCRGAFGETGGRAAALLYAALLCAAGGAMLAATGEACALMLPVRHADRIGMLAAMSVCFGTRRRGLKPLAWLGVLLVPCCTVLFALLLQMPAEAGTAWRAAERSPGCAALSAACYAAFNAAFSAGVLCEAGAKEEMARSRKSAWLAAAVFGAMLLLGGLAFYKHCAAAQGEPLPAVRLARAFGPAGYWLCAVSLLAAVLTSYAASARALARMIIPKKETLSWLIALFMTALTARLRFAKIVDALYPLLGAACMLCFAAIFLKTRGKNARHPCRGASGCAILAPINPRKDEYG